MTRPVVAFRQRNHAACVALLAAVALIVAAYSWPEAARAATVVSGEADLSVPLVIDPTGDPADPLVTQAADDESMFIQNLPASRTITRVTIGDLARAAGCTATTTLRGYIRESVLGSWNRGDDQIASSPSSVPLGDALTRVTFVFPPTRLVAGRAYDFIAQASGCGLRRRTWQHNQPTVNGGSEPCDVGGAEYRMWHIQGQNDRVAECSYGGSQDAFDASMPGGWLVSRQNSGTGSFRFIPTRTTPAEGSSECSNIYPPPSQGIEEVYWREDPNPSPSYLDEYVCRFTQFGPLGQAVPDGWYHAPTPVLERNSAPRDMYLKLEYNPDDDIRVMPDCAGLLFEECRTRVNAAGFSRTTRITLNGSDVDFSLPPDGVKRTDPVAGTLIPVSSEIVIYANPGESVYRATRFKPILKWDTSEDYRPLNVDEFFGEFRHRVCHAPDENVEPPCTILWGAGALADFTHPGDYIHVQGLEDPPYGKDDDDYKTNRDCIGGGIYECDRGPYAATYFHHVPSGAPGGYEVFDYWWFYRFNRVPDLANDLSIARGSGPLLHEGDWESISVGVRPNADVFDYAAFSQHGTWWGYLRDNVECDAGGAFSCTSNRLGGAWSGKRVHSYVANGTHANYPTPCSLQPPLDYCFQNTDGCPETGHDGQDTWSGGDDPTTSFTELFDERAWVRWQGHWGAPGSLHEGFADGPNGPGAPGTDNGLHYDAPWNRTCAPANPGCDPDLQAGPTRSASTSSLRSCDGWFGDAVAALACEPTQLETALRSAALGREGDLRIYVSTAERPSSFTPREASAPGLAQALADPLREGDEITIEGAVGPDAVVLLRLAGQADPVEITLDEVARHRHSRTLRIIRGEGGPLQLVGPGSLTAAPRTLRSRILRDPLRGPSLGPQSSLAAGE